RSAEAIRLSHLCLSSNLGDSPKFQAVMMAAPLEQLRATNRVVELLLGRWLSATPAPRTLIVIALSDFCGRSFSGEKRAIQDALPEESIELPDRDDRDQDEP